MGVSLPDLSHRHHDADDVIVILDAGAQYCKVIDRRIRELSIRAEIMPFETPASAIADKRYKGVIISGGPNSLADNPDLARTFDRDILTTKPVLGICYGMQLLNVIAGGTMTRKATREDGVFNIDLDASPLWHNIPSPTTVLLTHGDSINALGDEYVVTARSSEHTDIVVGIAHRWLPLYGVQFHPEVNLTTHGVVMLRNFVLEVCSCRQTYTPVCRQQAAIEYIQDAVGPTAPILVLASGGVDSSVVCALLSKAVRHERIVAIHIDTGFMRHAESASVMAALADLGLQLHYIDARERFANATTVVNGILTPPLHRVSDPELKRQIIGDCFMAVCDDELRRLGLDADTCILAQGSLRPDLIESGSPSVGKAAQVIKTHHNDTAVVRRLRQSGRIVEPLRDYHKDEARSLGVELGLSESLVWRQPFPGPGLAIRIVCAAEPYLPANLDAVAAQLAQFRGSNLSVDLLPVRTVGVQGDGRSYASLVGLRSTKPDWVQLMSVAKTIPKKVLCVNRIVFVFAGRGGLDDLGAPVPLTVTPSSLLPLEINLVRRADRIVNEILLAHNLNRVLAQVPVILFPADFGAVGQRCVTLRPFVTDDFMTGLPAVPGLHFSEDVLNDIVSAILTQMPEIERVCYDVTGKPPGTTEWE